MSNTVYIRDYREEDLDSYLRFNRPDLEHHNYNGPYYPKESVEELTQRVDNYRELFKKGENPFKGKRAIASRDNEELIGQVNWYWKSIETQWLEVGIVIFNSDYWGRGIGYRALKLWIDEVFTMFPQIIRIGLSTWSGNLRMVELAKKLGLKEEARYIKARLVGSDYYDSLSYGILREEWFKKG